MMGVLKEVRKSEDAPVVLDKKLGHELYDPRHLSIANDGAAPQRGSGADAGRARSADMIYRPMSRTVECVSAVCLGGAQRGRPCEEQEGIH